MKSLRMMSGNRLSCLKFYIKIPFVVTMFSETESDFLMTKVQLILESPTEREKYKNLNSSDDKLSFLSNHFIMDDMSVRLIKRRYLLSKQHRDEFVQSIEDIIRKIER